MTDATQLHDDELEEDEIQAEDPDDVLAGDYEGGPASADLLELMQAEEDDYYEAMDSYERELGSILSEYRDLLTGARLDQLRAEM